MRFFSYIVRYDFGFAPNPFEGFCTVATCKPQIRRSARIGDYVIGTGSGQKQLAGRLVYAMRVDEVLTFNQYWNDPRFSRKIPSDRGPLKRAYGDNIYHQDSHGDWVQANSRHSLPTGQPNPGHVEVDTSADAVLVSSNFTYFGGSGPEIPDTLRNGSGVDLVHAAQGHRCRFPADLVAAAAAWLDTLESGVQGRPADW